jgi:hypothetical protein
VVGLTGWRGIIFAVAAIVPSYLAKIHRAERHLDELQAELDRFAGTEPYRVDVDKTSKRAVQRLKFTKLPENTEIPIITADVVYNLRSALDHLMAALVDKKDRKRVMFPIFFCGVWEPEQPGDNGQQIKERGRWASDTRTMHAKAVEFLRGCQPPKESGDHETADLLRFVNRLSNRDRHERLPVVATGIERMLVRFAWPDGKVQHGLGIHQAPESFFANGAQIRFPRGATNAEIIEGTPVLAIVQGEDHTGVSRYLQIPLELSLVAMLIKERIIPGLAPYVKP